MLSLTLCSVNDHNNKKPDYVRMIDKMSSGSVSCIYLSLRHQSTNQTESKQAELPVLDHHLSCELLVALLTRL